jgi:glutaredoxin 2
VGTAIELLKLASVGIVAGLFSSFIANRDHRDKRWWELRVAAYQSAIESLSDLVYYYNNHWNAEIEQRDMTPEVQERLREIWDTSVQKVRRLADSGAFLFSDEANAALKEFMKEENYDSFFESVDGYLAKAKTCLSSLVSCSKKDLRLRQSFLERWS